MVGVLLVPSLLRSLALAAACLVAAGCLHSHVRQGDQMAEGGKWDEAVKAYRQALKDDPFNENVQDRLNRAKVRAAEQHYLAGTEALEGGHLDQAVREYEWAVGFDPARREHHVALSEALRLKEAREQLEAADKLKHMGRLDDALAAYERAIHLDPELTVALDGITEVATRQRTVKTMADSTQPVTLRFQKAKLREVFEILARTAGVNVVFDKDVRDDPVTMFLKDMPYDEALKLILHTHDLMAHRVAADTILITPNTKQKEAQYQDLMIRTFYLSNAEAKNVVNLLRSMLESKRVYADEQVNAVVVRDEPAKLHLAERVIHAIDRRQPEVVLDLEVLEVNRTKSMKYGLNFAKSAAAGVVPPGFTGELSTAPTRFTYQQLTAIGTSSYLFTLPASLLLDFFKQESDARTLASPKIRVVNKEKASITVGDKQPILLSTTNVLPGQTSTGAVPTTSTVTSTEFKDTGVKLTVEPIVHLVDELTLKLKVEVTRLGDEVILQSSPEIKQFKFGSRTAETTLRVRDNETVVLAGLISDEHRKNRASVPWLDSVPLLGSLFSSTTTDVIETEIVLTITPRIVRRMETPGLEGQVFWSGTQDHFSTDPLFAPAPRRVSLGGDAATTPVAAPGAGPPSSPSAAPPIPAPSPPAETSKQETISTGSPPETPPQAAPAPGPLARGAGVLALRPARLLTTVGQEFRVDLTADQLGSFTASEVTLSFDARLLEFLRVTEGEVLGSAAGPSGATVGGEPEAGRVVLQLRRPAGAQVVSGSLASLVFRAKAPGTSHLVLEAPTVTGAEGALIPVTVRPGAVVVR